MTDRDLIRERLTAKEIDRVWERESRLLIIGENLARAARRALMNPDNPEWPAKLHEALEAWERK